MTLLLAIITVGLTLAYLLSRKRQPARPDLAGSIGGAELADALASLAAASQWDATWSEVVTDLLERLGADEETIEEMLRSQGAAPQPSRFARRRHRDQQAIRRQHQQVDLLSELEKALIVGVALAAADDDYGHVSDPADSGANRDDSLEARAQEIESAVSDNRDRSQYEFYTKACLVLQDMLADTRDDRRKECILQVRDRFEEQLDELSERLNALMSSLRAAQGPSNVYRWPSSEDRQLYYFMMGVTNTLRKHKGHFPGLDALYRAKGLGYNVVEAYDRLARDCPALDAAREVGIRHLLAYDFRDIQALVRSTLPQR